MLIRKDVWDLVKIRLKPNLETIWKQKMKKNQITIEMVT